MLGKRSWGSINYGVCRACQRMHVQHAAVLAVMQGEGHKSRLLRFARTKAPRGYRWTLGQGVDRTARERLSESRHILEFLRNIRT
jgi:hypothetical protein